MATSDILEALIEKDNGYLITSKAVESGVSKPSVSKYVREHDIPHLPILMVVLLFLALESGRMELGILLDLRMRINLRETFGTQFMILRR